MEKQKPTIEEVLTRSVSQILPSKDLLEKALKEGKKLRIYSGADATGPKLHLGHSTNFIMLERLRKLGHEIIVLFGDFTAMIGDPTDKGAARVRLTKEQVEENIVSWKEQVSHLIDFEDKENPVRIVRNSEWLSKMTFSDVVDLASNFTVQQMLERDMFEKRLEEGKPIYVHEFFYPLMQGYDSAHLDVDVEIGGTDQTFNMLVGRTLQKVLNNKEKFVITTTLLENPLTGKKLMSKSEGNFVALNDEPNTMFGKIMALPDEVVVALFIDCTYVSVNEIKEIEKEMESGALNPRDAKLQLAREVVTIYHGEDAARDAHTYFVSTFTKKEIPEDVAEVLIASDGVKLTEFLMMAKLATSNADARRKIEQGGVSVDGEKLSDWKMILDKTFDGKVMKVGKFGFAKIVFKK